MIRKDLVNTHGTQSTYSLNSLALANRRKVLDVVDSLPKRQN